MALSMQSVAKLAEQCIDRFDRTLEIPSLANNQWAENRRADFPLWVDGVGARARQHASLDSRLESREDELSLIKTILLNLKSYLGRCLTAAGEEPLREAKLDVDAAIDNLALIAVAIRRAGKKSRLSRADKSFDRATLVELEIHLTCMALLRRTSPKEEVPKHHEDDPTWWKDEIEDEPTPLQDRLIEANLLRRNRFLYAQKHSKKLAIPQVPAKEPVAILPVPDRKEVSSPKQIVVTHRQVPDNDVREMENLPVLAPMSLTRASDIDSNLNLKEPKIAFRAPKTQITSITGATEYPKLRKPPVGKSSVLGIEQTKIQKCPCCCEALPRVAVASKNAWKKHLSGDVRPYTCISEDCPSPFVLYSTRAEWEDHMRKEHPKKWKCQLCDSVESSLFSEVADLVEHVRQTHIDSLLEGDIEAVQLWPSTFTIGLDTCPLCRSAGPLDDPKLIDHVLEHTHEFALLSLPWAGLPTETFQEPTTPDFYDLGYLRPVEARFLSSLMTSFQSDGYSSEKHGLPYGNVEPSTTEESAIQTVQSPMLTWLDRLDMPGPKEWGDSVAVLDTLRASRTAKSSSGKDDYFAWNPYFASDSEASTQDGHFSRSAYFASESEASTQYDNCSTNADFGSDSEASTQDSVQGDEDPNSSALVEQLRFREIRDHGERLYYDDLESQRYRILDPEKWTQVDDLIREIRLALDAAQVHYPLDPSMSFIPRSKFDEVMKPQKVLELVHGLECFQGKTHEEKQQIAQDICYGATNRRPSLKILGALVASEQVWDLARHMQNGLTDGCLPLIYGTPQVYLRCQCLDADHIALINDPMTVADDRETLVAWTRKLIAPYIRYQPGKGLHCHYILEKGNCLPIQVVENAIPSQRGSERRYGDGSDGDFSEVFKVKIYDCHCRLEDNGMRNSRGYYALKKLTFHDLVNFDLELSSLLLSADYNRTRGHMVQVLASFEEVNPVDHQSTYYLLFDWAEGNLEDFWRSNESVVQNCSHCLWMAEQFLGLGKALVNVQKARQRLRRLANADSFYGHGNIKPSNILLFRPQGVKRHLALTDFGLGELRTNVSRFTWDSKKLGRTEKYRSPEFDLPDGLVGPESDVYSLGCVFLEYITWFLRGPVLDRFSDERTEKDIYGFEVDTFFTFEGNKQMTVVPKPAVKHWIESLKEEEACSWYLIRMLGLIETEMIQVDRVKRISAWVLVKRLRTLSKVCKRDPSFYTKNWKQPMSLP